MNIMGMNMEDFNSIFRIVSAVLLFGSMQFKQERNSDQATLPDNTVAQKIAHLLGKHKRQLLIICSYVSNYKRQWFIYVSLFSFQVFR